jgi:hypothetical protein
MLVFQNKPHGIVRHFFSASFGQAEHGMLLFRFESCVMVLPVKMGSQINLHNVIDGILLSRRLVIPTRSCLGPLSSGRTTKYTG